MDNNNNTFSIAFKLYTLGFSVLPSGGGKSGHQRELSRLFADLHNRKVDTCLLWALDRLTRKGIAKILS